MKIRLPLLALALIVLAGCAQNPPSQESAPPVVDRAPVTYDGETLGDLLVAEDAVQRRAPEVALIYYSKAATNTGDPGVLAEATRLATHLGQPEQARDLSTQWLQSEPDNEAALRLATLAALAVDDQAAARSHLDRLIATHGDDAVRTLVVEARSLEAHGIRGSLSALSRLAPQYPQQPALWFARALHERRAGNLAAATAAIDHALDKQPDKRAAQLFKGQLLLERGHPDQALRYLQGLVEKHPDDRHLRLAYVQTLLAAGQADRAIHQLQTVADDHPDNPDLQYSLALIALDSQMPRAARGVLHRLLEQGYRRNEVLVHLGRAAEMEGDPAQAIDYYRQVQGANRLPARVQAAQLLYASGDGAAAHSLITGLMKANPERSNALVVSEARMRTESGDGEGALALLKQALTEQPDSPDLRYARAMTFSALGRYGAMERDLQHILAARPDNPSALNALGYTWADEKRNLSEARDMIERALRQQPANPAFLDSMGWVLYRLGQLDRAEQYLFRAHAASPDAEIAAHLGEVLWMNGKKDQARRIWKAGLSNAPESPSIRDTLHRLEVEL